MTPQEAYEAVDAHMRRMYSLPLEAMEPAETPGYWRGKQPCRGECGMGHRQAMHHTYFFAQWGPAHQDGEGTWHEMPKGADGRYVSPYRAWRLLRGDVQAVAKDAPPACPTCRAPWDRVEREVLGGSVGRVAVLRRGPAVRVCVGGHRFVVRGT